MREHPSARVHEAWTEIIRDYEGTGELVTFRMRLGDQDVSQYLDSGTLSADVGALPWSLDVNLAKRIPETLLNAPVTLFVEMAGVLMPLFKGFGSYPTPSAEWTTQLSALTPGHWMDKATLDTYVEYNGWTPQAVIQNALFRVPYDRSLVKVDRFDTPLIYRLRADAPGATAKASWGSGFEDEDTPLSIMTSVTDEIGAVSIDHALGGNDTFADPGIGENSELAWDYDAATSEVIEPFVAPAWAEPEDQYTRVRVRDRLESGGYRIPPKDFTVDYTGMEYPPVVGRTYYVNLSDQTAEAETRARNEAIKTAKLLGKGLRVGGMVVDFNPFLTPYDVITVRYVYEDDTGRYRRLYRCVIEGITHDFGTTALSTSLSFKAALARDQRIPDPPIVLQGVSAGVTATPGAGIAYGVDEIGLWIDPSKISGLYSWAGVDQVGGNEYLWVDPARAPEGLFGDDVNGFYLDV